jgi:hypothetical protein
MASISTPSLQQLITETARRFATERLPGLFNELGIDETIDELCAGLKFNKQLLAPWIKEVNEFFPASDKITILTDIFVHYHKDPNVGQVKQIFLAKMFVHIRTSGKIPDQIDGWDEESMAIEDIFYKAVKLQGRKKLCEQNVAKAMLRLIDYEIKECRSRKEVIRQGYLEDIIMNVENEKRDSFSLYLRDNFEDHYGRDSILTHKRRMFDTAERISIEATNNEMTPNILDCFNEQMQNYMDAMMRYKEGDVEDLSKQLVKFYDMIKHVVEMTPTRKRTSRKRKQKKKQTSAAEESDEQSIESDSDDEEILLTKKECLFCGKPISSVSIIEQCRECLQK